MSLEELSGEDVELAVQRLKETAVGLDQWNPADLKLLSKETCKALAVFFNMIEEWGIMAKAAAGGEGSFSCQRERLGHESFRL